MSQDDNSRPRSPLWTISPGSLSPRSHSPKFPYSYHERSTSELIRLSCSVVAVEFAYSYTGYVTPLLFERGLSPQAVGLIWAVAPCLGMVLSPILGSISDRWESRFGRRRPFILALGFFLCLGLFILPNASNISDMMFGAKFAYSRLATVALTVVGVIMVDFCCDSLQSPIRTYMLDVVPLVQQEKANAFFGLFVGIGGSAGFLSLGLDWIKLFPFLQFLETQLRVVCYVAILIFVFFILITVTSVKEEPYVPLPYATESASEAQGPSLLDRINTLRHTPYLRSLCLVHFLGYLAYISYLLYFTDFVSVTLYAGEASADPSSPAYQRYQDGVRTGSLCMAGYAFTATLHSAIVPWLLSRFPVRLVYALPLVLFGASALAAVFFSKLVAMIAVSIAAGIFFASLYTIPFIILAGFEKPSEADLESDEEYDDYEEGLDMFKTSVQAQLAAKNAHVPSETDLLTGKDLDSDRWYGSVNGDGDQNRHREREQVDGENAGMHVALLSSMQMMAQVFLAAIAGSLIAFGSVSAIMTLSAVAAILGSIACLGLHLPSNLI